MKYKLPLSLPKYAKVTITQPFGDTSKIEWYKENGLNLTAHNGVDLVVGDSTLTYGTRIVCPVSNAELSQAWWDGAMSTKGNGIQIAWEEGKDRYNMRCWHCSEIVKKLNYREADTIGYIGNSGLVVPKPTPQHPFNGAHLHLMLYKNGVLIDPLLVFDVNNWYITPDTGVDKDTPPIKWSLDWIQIQVGKLFTLLGIIRK